MLRVRNPAAGAACTCLGLWQRCDVWGWMPSCSSWSHKSRVSRRLRTDHCASGACGAPPPDGWMLHADRSVHQLLVVPYRPEHSPITSMQQMHMRACHSRKGSALRTASDHVFRAPILDAPRVLGPIVAPSPCPKQALCHKQADLHRMACAYIHVCTSRGRPRTVHDNESLSKSS